MMERPASPHDIRPLGVDDAEAWRALRLQALKEHPAAFSSSWEEASQRDLEAFRAQIPRPDEPDALFGLFVDGALEGVAGFRVQEGLKVRHKGLLWGVYVRPRARGAGGAQALVASVIERARAHVAILQAVVSVANPAARRLYAALGFRAYGVEPAALRVDGVDHDDELLWLDLRPGADSLPAGALSVRRAP